MENGGQASGWCEGIGKRGSKLATQDGQGARETAHCNFTCNFAPISRLSLRTPVQVGALCT